ncbi:MAG: hypothetical protein ACD_24C00421G0004 [uncultured bacterium]|nr:MAG: hypothetical protein ACD_24C00421G0004 [uncultured bacterium]
MTKNSKGFIPISLLVVFVIIGIGILIFNNEG